MSTVSLRELGIIAGLGVERTALELSRVMLRAALPVRLAGKPGSVDVAAGGQVVYALNLIQPQPL